MIDASTAKQYHNKHHLQHGMMSDKQQYKIPVYVEDEAVNVRVHDLPPRTTNNVIKEHLQQFGTILSISREMWKNYFPGVYNGVRVVRMRVTKPIPSYLTIDDETTLVTYRNQTKTCRFCGQKAHPRQKCGKNSTTTKNTDNNADPAPFKATEFPSLDETQQQQQQQQPQQQQQQQQLQKSSSTTADQNTPLPRSHDVNNSSDVEWAEIDSDEALTGNNKRRLSTKKREESELKRMTVNQGYQKQENESEQGIKYNKRTSLNEIYEINNQTIESDMESLDADEASLLPTDDFEAWAKGAKKFKKKTKKN